MYTRIYTPKRSKTLSITGGGKSCSAFEYKNRQQGRTPESRKLDQMYPGNFKSPLWPGREAEPTAPP